MEKNSFKSELIEDIKTIGITLIVALFVVNFIARPVKVDGSSMVPTLKDKTYGFTSVISRKLNKIDRFDLVVLHLGEEHDLIKRVIGLPGETVSVVNEVLFIDGIEVKQDFFNEEYLKNNSVVTGFITPITLGENEYFCLGDNRSHSSDSRYYGAFTKDQITSVGFFGIWPFSEFGGKK